jgi:hypothetical protein
VSGTSTDVERFYQSVFHRIGFQAHMAVDRERDHHGSGYASYISAFLYPRDGNTTHRHETYDEDHGFLLYVSRLAPLAVFGASSRTRNHDGDGGSSSFIDANTVGVVPSGDWHSFLMSLGAVLAEYKIDLLPRELLLRPLEIDLRVPTAFDPPYYVFDALFYWED